MTNDIVMAADTAITTNLVPALIFMVGGMLVPFFKGRAKSVYMLLIPVVGFLNLIHIPIGDHHYLAFGDFNLVLLHVDRLSLLFGYIFHIVAFIAVIYILGFKNDVEYVAGFFYAGAALGTIFAGDLFTFFRAADNDLPIRNFIYIKRVHRLTNLKHDIVGNINNV